MNFNEFQIGHKTLPFPRFTFRRILEEVKPKFHQLKWNSNYKVKFNHNLRYRRKTRSLRQ